MKLITLAIFTISLAILKADEALPKLDAQLEKGVYEFSGSVTTTMGKNEFAHNFSGNTTAQCFMIEWEQDMNHFKMTGSVDIKGNKGVVFIQGKKYSESNAEMAIASATGVSGGAAHLLYSLWSGKSSDIFPNKNVKVVKSGAITTITGVRGQEAITIMVKDSKIQSIKSIFDPKKKQVEKPEEVTDEQIKEILKMTNKEVTKESIAEIKKMLADSETQLSNLKEVIESDTVINIKLTK